MYHKVLVTAIDPITLEVLGAACDAIEAHFNAMCIMEDPLSVPEGAYDPARNQYRSDVILGYLHLIAPEHAEKVLAVTELDLYVGDYNFVFGQAVLNGRYAIVSVARLRPEFYGQPPNVPLLLERLRKEVVHELGHTYGLEHCQVPGCVMRFSNSVRDVDAKQEGFCPRCRTLLDQRLHDDVA